MRAVVPPITWFTPYSVTDMLRASVLVQQQPDWDWTIIRAPTLADTRPREYTFCQLTEIAASDALSRKDCAACLLDSVSNPEHYRHILAVRGAGQ